MDGLERFSLHGKTALVTGASRGIGLAMAEALAEAGADIIAVSSQMGPGSEVEKRVTRADRQCWPVQCDLAQPDALYGLLAEVERMGRPVDILVNNAGTTVRKPVLEQTDADWDRVLAVNLRAPFILSRELGRQMVARRSGKIIFTASVMAFQGGILVAGYTASKGGVAQLAKALATEWTPHNVQVNAIAPGYIATAITAPLQDDPKRDRDILIRTPAGRWGEPDDLKGAVVFLASPASDFVTGSVLVVDGGWMAR